MVRAPCCEKMGLKKGPWTPEEDETLVNYIQRYGHGNWRALPKQAGLLRCGKSCRLRWTNYLRPDIKRGNFTRNEEDTIIRLHEMLGNRWSAIAARLPGRTDNEIKNVWHTHLKKRLKQNQENPKKPSIDISRINQKPTTDDQESKQCSSDSSSITTTDTENVESVKVEPSSSDDFSEMLDENFWSEVLSAENSSFNDDVSVVDPSPEINMVKNCMEANVLEESMDYFWYKLFTRAGESPDLLEI